MENTVTGFLYHEGQRFYMQIKLAWHENDPWAVSMTFKPEGLDPAVWVFGAELFREGFDKTKDNPAGIGDVQCYVDGPHYFVYLYPDIPGKQTRIGFVIEQAQRFAAGIRELDIDVMAELSKLGLDSAY